ncbi:MAG: glycosyltransferase [Candidatus Latescibacteria bacterium]|jgi:glycosyltransferase involved in cell wall biosynthesis|nr:glycosyltransferase [Candidatus Latescibacterota bacterium]
MKISVIIPCYNEEASLEAAVTQVREALDGRDFEVVPGR